MKSLRLLSIVLCLTASAAGAQAVDLTITPETQKAIDEAVKAMGERKEPEMTPAEFRTWQRDSCVPDGHHARDLTIKECKREIAWTRGVLNDPRPHNIGISTTRCADYCKTLYPKLPGY
jgi:hypothetical protein